jgi:FAD synthase
VHAAHKVILNRLKQIALEKNGETVVMTFDPHPRMVLFPDDHGLKLLHTLEEKIEMINGLIKDFKDLMSYYDIPEFNIGYDYPILYINKLEINLKDFSYKGEHDDITDAFRDFARRYGIRVYTPQGYRFKLNRK